MFGFSLQKLLVLVAIIAAVWYGFKFIGRLDKTRKDEARAALKSARRATQRGASRPPRAPEAEEMVACEACGDYVPARGATSCGREDCPYPG